MGLANQWEFVINKFHWGRDFDKKIFLLPLKFCIKILREIDFIGITRSVIPGGENLILTRVPRVCKLKSPKFQTSLGMPPPTPS